MPIYSFGVNSVMKLELTEDQAMRYNRFTAAFFAAQKKILDETGIPWNFEDKIWIDGIEEGDMENYNAVADIINSVIPTIDQDITPIEIEDDFLIKN